MSFKKSSSEIAIVVGGFVNGLGLVRSLGEQNLQVVVIATQDYDIAQYSRHVTEYHHVKELETCPEKLVSLLRDNCEKWKGAVVFPSNDEAIAALDKFRDQLEPCYKLGIPPPDSVPYILNKTKMLQAAAKVGIQLPKCYGKAADASISFPEIIFPVVIKPEKANQFSLRFDSKLFPVRNRDELLRYSRLLDQEGITGEIFDQVPGPDSDIYIYCVYVNRQGDPVAECTVHKIRQSPPFFGIARIAELSETIPVLKDQTLELLKQINFRGVAAAEFKYDSRDNSFKFFEINGRSVVYNTLLKKGGLNLTELARADLSEETVSPAKPESWPGAWIHLHADLLRTMQNWRREQLSIGDYIKPYGRPRTFAVWSAGDPKPFFSQWSRSLRHATHLLSGKSGSVGRKGSEK